MNVKLRAAGAVDIGRIDDFPPKTMKMVRVGDRRLCVVNTGDGLFALDQACPHEGYGLTTGELNCDHPDGPVVTCAWHNWKFRVADGVCVQGEEDVLTHRVDVAADGAVFVRLTEPDPDELRPRYLASLRSGIERQYTGQIARDVIRLLRLDTNPGELIWEAVAYGAPRAEFGWGHSIASLTDCVGMLDQYGDDDRALPIVQAIAGVAETERGRPERPLPEPALVSDLTEAGTRFRLAVEDERTEEAQAIIRGALRHGASSDDLKPWFTAVVADHHLSYGHGAIYGHKAFELLERLGWDRADTVLPHLVPTLVFGTREDKLPYMRLFHRGVEQLSLAALAEAASTPRDAWLDDGRLAAALLGDDRTEAALAAGAALTAGAGLSLVLDQVVLAVSQRLLRYDPAGERDFHDDFGWLDITHGLTYANSVRWHLSEAIEGRRPVTEADVRLVLWTVFLANWTGRHEWHTEVMPVDEVEPLSDDPAEYGRLLQHQSLLDGTSAFIVHAHAVKTSVAATKEALAMDSLVPLNATARFLAAPRLERFVARTVVQSIDFLSGAGR